MKVIVITSIFSPTEAVEKFSQLSDYQTIIVGDKKTPHDWHLDGVEFLSVDKQEALGFKIHQSLPYNEYCRKMAGYVYAIKNGAQIIIDTDDDNIPYSNWDYPDFQGSYLTTGKNKDFVNTYSFYTDQHIWPRGLPLNFINSEEVKLTKSQLSFEDSNVGIWQGLADQDPDVDAVYRLLGNKECIFQKKKPIVLNKGTLSPFNSQNTAFLKKVFALLYLPVTTTFRFTDILRGYVAQPILWAYGLRLGFTEATVIQKRNPHDYMQDFELEVPLYLHSEKVPNIVAAVVKAKDSIEDNLYNAYEALCIHNILAQKEMQTLQAWLEDIT